MIYEFIDNKGTFRVKNPCIYNFYFPLTNSEGTILSAISPQLSGDIKQDNEHFLTQPASVLDLKNNLFCRREFFLNYEGRLLRMSSASDEDVLEAGLLYQKIQKKFGPLQCEILNFVPFDLPAEVMVVKVKNTSSAAVKITPTSFLPLFARAERNLRDHRHVSSLLNRLTMSAHGLFLSPTMVFDENGHTRNKTIYYSLGYQDDTVPPEGQFPTLDYFFGSGDISRPEAVCGIKRPATEKNVDFDGKEACAALRFAQTLLNPAEERQYVLISGISQSQQRIQEIFNALDKPSKVKDHFQRTVDYWNSYVGVLDLDFPDKDYNNWLRWVRLQPTLRKLFGCSFLPHFDYGKGGRGWRDLWQDALTLVLSEPEKARGFILNNFRGVRLDGSNATIITKDSFISDRNRINRVWMDHGVWPYLTLRFYVNKSADIDILLQKREYFRDHLLARSAQIDRDFKQKDFLQRDDRGRVYKGSVLEHILIENLVQFFNVGKHNLTRLENADWNDGLDMAARNGESATFNFMYAYNINDLADLLEALGKSVKEIELLPEVLILLDGNSRNKDYSDYRYKRSRLEKYFSSVKVIKGKPVKVRVEKLVSDLRAKYEHLKQMLNRRQWLQQEGFFSGYYDDNARPVEGRSEGKTRMLLQTQVFAIMSGIAGVDQIKRIWESINNHLFDSELGGFRLNTDFGGIYPAFGRAFGFSYGEKENGAFFNHMNVMLGNALLKRGFVAQGRQVLGSIYRMSLSDKSQITPCLPEYFNGSGKGLYLYLTGSASWYIYTLLEQVLGIKFSLGDMVINPGLLAEDFKGGNINVEFTLKKKHRVKATFSFKGVKQSGSVKIARVSLNGRELAPEDGSCLIAKENFKGQSSEVNIILE